MEMKKLLLTVVLCGTCLGNGLGTGGMEKVSAETIAPRGITLTAEELNAGTTAENPWKKMFDFWSNAGKSAENVLYTTEGVVIEGTDKNNAMNLINAPMSVAEGARFEMTFNIPLRDGQTGEMTAPQTKYMEKAAVVLYNGETMLATAYIWGDSYKTGESFITADFEVGQAKASSLHLPKKVMETGGGIRLGFDLTNGWYCELTDEGGTEYRAVSDTFEKELSKVTAQELTRVRVMQKWDDSAVKTKFVVKELNGQTLCLDDENKLFADDCYNISALKTEKDAVFLVRETYAFELLGVKESSSECNTKQPRAGTAVWAYAHTGLMGDIGWNSDGSKGPERGSGLWLTLTADDGTVCSETFYNGSWGDIGQPAIEFTFAEAGRYTLKATLLTARGYVTVRTLEITAQETPHILLLQGLPANCYVGTVVKLPAGRLMDADGKTVLVDGVECSVSFANEAVALNNGSFTVTESGKYTVTYFTEYEGKRYEKTAETNGRADTLKRIEITAAPQKTTYVEGEKFDGTGMVVCAVYESGKKEEISDYTLDKETLRLGDTSVIVSYHEKKTVLEIKVNMGEAEDSSSGCGSNIGGVSVLVGALAVVGLYLWKKRKASKIER